MSASSKLTAWGRLLRLPNLLTVPGDPLVGFVIIAGASFSWTSPALWAAMGASVLLYAAGLIHNDLCDLAEDRRDRPNRPLACGAILPATAATVAIILTLSACTLAWFFCNPIATVTAATLAIMVLLYNALLKCRVIPGAIAMGLCRGLSVLLGVTVASPLAQTSSSTPEALAALYTGAAWALLWTAYIATVTILASGETRTQRLSWSRYLPAITLFAPLTPWILSLATLFLMFVTELQISTWTMAWMGVWIVATINAASPIWKLRGLAKPADIQRMIGRLIRNLLLIQAAFLFGSGQWQAGIVFLILHPIHARLARWFYAS